MSACVSFLFCMCIVLSAGVTVNRYNQPDIISETKIELSPILVPCGLSDLVVVSAPIVENARYYLHSPNGEARTLNITKPPKLSPKETLINIEYDSLVIRYDGDFKSITPVNNFEVYNLDTSIVDDNDIFKEHEKKLNANEFIIGPLSEDDHGNWVLSAFTRGRDGKWMELFQVITVEITEHLPAQPRAAKLHEGDSFKLSFAHPIAHVTSCAVTAPRTTFDRSYERDRHKMAACGYIVRNVTRHDQGTWRITAVGKIVYRTQVHLKIMMLDDCDTCGSELNA